MSGNPRLSLLAHYLVKAILRLNFQYGAGQQIPEVDAAFYFRLDDVAADRIAEVGVRFKKWG